MIKGVLQWKQPHMASLQTIPPEEPVREFHQTFLILFSTRFSSPHTYTIELRAECIQDLFAIHLLLNDLSDHLSLQSRQSELESEANPSSIHRYRKGG